MMRLFLRTVGAVLLVAAPLHAQGAAPLTPTPESLAMARQVLTAMDAERLFIVGVEAALPGQRRLQPNIPAIFWDSMTAQMHRRAPEVVDSMAQAYAGYFTTPQLRELLTFYQSTAGRHLAEVQSDLTLAMSAIGQRWGSRVAADVIKQLVDQGVSFGDQ